MLLFYGEAYLRAFGTMLKNVVLRKRGSEELRRTLKFDFGYYL